MTHKSRRIGNRLELRIVKEARLAGIEAERAWGSNGKSIGLDPDVDGLIGSIPFQAKRRITTPGYMMPSVPMLLIVAQKRYVVTTLSNFLHLLKGTPIGEKVEYQRKVVDKTYLPNDDGVVQVYQAPRKEIFVCLTEKLEKQIAGREQ